VVPTLCCDKKYLQIQVLYTVHRSSSDHSTDATRRQLRSLVLLVDVDPCRGSARPAVKQLTALCVSKRVIVRQHDMPPADRGRSTSVRNHRGGFGGRFEPPSMISPNLPHSYGGQGGPTDRGGIKRLLETGQTDGRTPDVT